MAVGGMAAGQFTIDDMTRWPGTLASPTGDEPPSITPIAARFKKSYNNRVGVIYSNHKLLRRHMLWWWLLNDCKTQAHRYLPDVNEYSGSKSMPDFAVG